MVRRSSGPLAGSRRRRRASARALLEEIQTGASSRRSRPHAVPGEQVVPATARAARLLLGDGDGEPLAALATTTLQGETTTGRLHALAETMRALATLVVGLIRALHEMLLRVDCDWVWGSRRLGLTVTPQTIHRVQRSTNRSWHCQASARGQDRSTQGPRAFGQPRSGQAPLRATMDSSFAVEELQPPASRLPLMFRGSSIQARSHPRNTANPRQMPGSAIR